MFAQLKLFDSRVKPSLVKGVDSCCPVSITEALTGNIADPAEAGKLCSMSVTNDSRAPDANRRHLSWPRRQFRQNWRGKLALLQLGLALSALKGFSQLWRGQDSFISVIHFANRQLSDRAEHTPKQ